MSVMLHSLQLTEHLFAMKNVKSAEVHRDIIAYSPHRGVAFAQITHTGNDEEFLRV